ncbi:hypothetical protein [Agromyces cerinus]|uniref:Uncharacterized protein n=1 Tax=Agromyces cerinus subsp. cerinus TaxID=232089 RepID=A0A1N6EV10_9MICO|nr:hypothetical protein [Agromyces cerinus]SIN86919.1 hypothetical protein SAMN05443544_1494 [Agromyces cerinus subsp. cerinus]
MNRAAQLARGSATALVALFLAAFSHGVAAGEAPGGVGLVLAGIVALGASVALVGRRTTAVRTTLAVIVSQGAFHLLFGVGAGASSGSFVVNGGGHHQQTVAFVDGGAAAPVGHVHADTAMLIGHALAAVATIVYLLAVEQVAWRTLTAAARRFVLRLTAPVPPLALLVPVVRRALATCVPRLRSRLRFTALGSRGPPLLLASA